MSLISGNPGSSQKQLSDWAGITGASLVGVIDELEKRGLVSRMQSATDRRRNEVSLTERGERTMSTMFEAVNEIEQPIREELGEEDMMQLIALVERAVGALEKAGRK